MLALYGTGSTRICTCLSTARPLVMYVRYLDDESGKLKLFTIFTKRVLMATTKKKNSIEYEDVMDKAGHGWNQ
jgi:hypothetical protein